MALRQAAGAIEESCGAIIHRIDRGTVQFLILRRADEDNVWEPPKGHRNTHETEIDAAARELHEELGLRDVVFHPTFREVLEYENSEGVLVRFIFFLVETTKSIKLSKEHLDYRWVTINELPSYFAYEDTRAIFQKALNTIQSLKPTGTS